MTHPAHVDVATYAEAAGLTERRVRYLIQHGEIKATHKGTGSPWLIPWSEYRKVAPEPKPARGRARPRRERAIMASIRWMWAFIFPGIGFALEWLVDIDKLIGFGLSIPIALAIGATLYALKRYRWPDTTI